MDKFQAVRLWGLALNFWQLTVKASSELIKLDNAFSMQYIGWDWPSDEEYDAATGWSDFNIVEPMLFNFYHGIELSLKALLVAKEGNFERGHKLTKLFSRVKALYGCETLNEFYGKYIKQEMLPALLQEFCRSSNTTMDMYFQSLKYPFSNGGADFNHSILRGNGSQGVVFFQTLCEDISCARKALTENISRECKDVLDPLFR